VFTAGACPLDEEGRVVAAGDVAGQIRRSPENLQIWRTPVAHRPGSSRRRFWWRPQHAATCLRPGTSTRRSSGPTGRRAPCWAPRRLGGRSSSSRLRRWRYRIGLGASSRLAHHSAVGHSRCSEPCAVPAPSRPACVVADARSRHRGSLGSGAPCATNPLLATSGYRAPTAGQAWLVWARKFTPRPCGDRLGVGSRRITWEPGACVAAGWLSARVSAAWMSVIGSSTRAGPAAASKVMSSVSIVSAARAWRLRGPKARRTLGGT
jgi:hypothetical protein